jgi:glutathione-independent formaldehyde dehydrogenase
VDKHAKKSEFLFPLGKFWNNGVTIGQGQAPVKKVKKYNVYLRDLIIAGKAKPSFIVSHRLPLRLSKAVEACAYFAHRGVGAGKSWTKVLLKPDANAARWPQRSDSGPPGKRPSSLGASDGFSNANA